jgi:hypothetical protein
VLKLENLHKDRTTGCREREGIVIEDHAIANVHAAETSLHDLCPDRLQLASSCMCGAVLDADLGGQEPDTIEATFVRFRQDGYPSRAADRQWKS